MIKRLVELNMVLGQLDLTLRFWHGIEDNDVVFAMKVEELVTATLSLLRNLPQLQDEELAAVLHKSEYAAKREQIEPLFLAIANLRAEIN
jgi:hypothetical protein